MPSDSIAGFLDKAKASRVLVPEQVEQLIRQPDIPQTDLAALCDYLESRGVLTRYQSEMLRAGRGYDLTFVGYPVIDELGPCPGGIAYKALHPSLRTPLILRRFIAETLMPADTPTAIAGRARSSAAVSHPHLTTLIDAGTAQVGSYATIDLLTDAADLESLVRDIGPMPAFLAAEFGRQMASALRAVHERGLWHGDLRPANVLVSPIFVKTLPDGKLKRRPAPNAVVKVAELGLVPIAPPAAISPPPDEVIPYLPPERLDVATPTAVGDLYGLGATLYYLLTGRPPFTGASADDLLNKVRTQGPASLAALRPDLPPEFTGFVNQLLEKDPQQRPPTAFDAEMTLAKFCRPDSVPKPATGPIPMATSVPEEAPAEVAEYVNEPANDWMSGGDSFSTAHADTAPAPKRKLTEEDKKRTKLMIILGLCLHLTAVAVLVAWLTGVFDRTPDPEPVPTKKLKDTKPKKKVDPNT